MSRETSQGIAAICFVAGLLVMAGAPSNQMRVWIIVGCILIAVGSLFFLLGLRK